MKIVNIICFLLIVVCSNSFAQNPFGDDPFADPEPQQEEPAQNDNQPDEPADENQQDDPFATDDDTFDGEATEPGFDESAPADDPFGSSPAGGIGNLPFGGGQPNQDILSNLPDTLVQPSRPQYPWEQKAIKERQVFDTYNVRESDVFWAKTVWREIDVREKMNHTFINPRAPFMTVLLNIIKNNDSLKLYEFDPFTNLDFQSETTWAEINEGLGGTEVIDKPVMDDEGNITYEKETVTNKFNVGSIKRFRIKEVWYFDNVDSRMKVAIMGIAPIKETTLSELGVSDISMNMNGGDQVSQDPLFWIYYPDIREELARYQTYNPLNDAIQMSWDDLFQSRFFSSFIVKASNPLDKDVKDYTRNNLAALYESENIKEEIFNFEHDLWSY